MMKLLSLSLSLSLFLRRSSAIVRTTVSLHSVGTVAAPGAPAGAEAGQQQQEQEQQTREIGERRKKKRTMASKDTSLAGFVNVSREITGELEH